MKFITKIWIANFLFMSMTQPKTINWFIHLILGSIYFIVDMIIDFKNGEY